MTLIAFVGLSCSGKTTLGSLLAKRLGVAFRSCGNAARAQAKELTVRIDDLPMTEHAAIDEATRVWCRGAESRLVEGRYLDQALPGIGVGVWLVELTARPEVRALRLARRSSEFVSVSDILAEDQKDAAFRRAAYGGTVPISALEDLDTSDMSELECLDILSQRLQLYQQRG